MKNNRTRSIIGMLLILVLIVATAFVSLNGINESGEGSIHNIKLGLDLSGGVSITYQADQDNPSSEDMNDTIYKLQKRVEVYSTEAEVYQEGSNRINVEIPGVYDAEAILAELGNPGTVQFYEVKQEDDTDTETETETEVTVESNADETLQAAGDETDETEVSTESVETEDNSLAPYQSNVSNIPSSETVTDDSESSESVYNEDGTLNTELCNLVMDGNDIADAQVTTQQNSYGNPEYVVSLTMTAEGAEKFAAATERNIGLPIYIVYDGNVISAPTVNAQIANGEAVIEGNFTYESASELATYIRLGALKLNLTELRTNVVGAKLGEQALSTSLKAGAIGIGLIIVFMVFVYALPGLASGLALLLYIFAMLCLLNGLDVTLTLPGIAGIILSIGMAVDANVIIFSRIKEEIAAGKNVRDAIRIGFKKATSAIVDGNITTLIAAVVLYLRGTGSIKGFSITLALGIILSMFTALVITRLIVNCLYGLGFTSEKYYGKMKERKPIQFVRHAKIFYVISVVVVIAGFVAMGINSASGKGSLNYSLDFTGGTSMTVELENYVDITSDEGAALLADITDIINTGDVQLQNVVGSNEIIIKTQELDSETRTALKDMLVENYGVDETNVEEESISAVVSDEMRTDAVVAVIVAGICMLIYIWFRFKGVKFGASSVIALLHDVLVVLAVYAIVRIPVGNTFIACMLTIVGYSINASIVVFDRIRENRGVMYKSSLEDIVNTSITQTLNRSIHTSLTTFISVLVLYIFGVTSIREFALPLMAGIIAGAWSSICIAGTIWYFMSKKNEK